MWEIAERFTTDIERERKKPQEKRLFLCDLREGAEHPPFSYNESRKEGANVAGASEVIVGILALLGTMIGSYFANNKNVAVMQEQLKNVREDIQTLSVRVDKHNNLVERMAKVEASAKSAHNRLDEIKREK